MANAAEVRRSRGKFLKRLREQRDMSQRSMAVTLLRHLREMNPDDYKDLEPHEGREILVRLQDNIENWEQGRHDLARSKGNIREAVAQCLGLKDWHELFEMMRREERSSPRRHKGT